MTIGMDTPTSLVNSTTKIDFYAAERFLSNFSGLITFQTFGESPEVKKDKSILLKLARHTSRQFDQIKNSLLRMNTQGAGIYFMVNEGDGIGRKIENVKRLRAFFLDFDSDKNGSGEEKLKKLITFVNSHPNSISLSPNIIVESSPGKFHVYWLLEEATASNFDLKRFSSVQKALALKFGGDPTVSDLSRVMRVPGFLWQKDPSAAFVVREVSSRELERLGGDILRNPHHDPQALVTAIFGSNEREEENTIVGQYKKDFDIVGRSQKREERPIPVFGEGERDVGLFKYACKLRSEGLGEEEIRQLVSVAASRCNPPFSAEEAEKKVEQAVKYRPGKTNEVIREEEINRRIHAGEAREKEDGEESVLEIFHRLFSPQTNPSLAAEDPSISSAKLSPLAYHREHNAWTDSGAAQFFVERYGDVIRITEDDRLWVWDGRKWIVDVGEDISRHKVASLAPFYRRMAAAYKLKNNIQKISNKKSREVEKCLAFAEDLGNSSRQTAVLRAIRGEARCRGKVEDFDAQPNIINLQNGVLNLDTWELLLHSDPSVPGLLCSKIASVSWSPEAVSPVFDRFVFDIMCGDKELIDYKFRQWGYVISGYTNQRALFFHYGEGGNGKTKEVDILAWVLGDYARELPASVYLEGGFESEKNYALSEFPGVRMAFSGEAGGDRAWNEEVMKLLTGDEGVLRARAIRQAPICFKPRFKPILHANNRPKIRTGSEAFWGRMHLIPYNFRADDSNRDENILEKMMQEADGIFLRFASGYREFRAAGGLRPPAKILYEREVYKENELDDLSDFLANRCELSVDYTCDFSELYKAYVDFCYQNNAKPRSKDSLASFLSSKMISGFYGAKNKAKRSGIRLKEEQDFSFEN